MPNSGQRRLIDAARALGAIRLNDVQRPVNDYAVPFEELCLLVDFEGDAAVAEYLAQFPRRCRAAVEPSVQIDVMDWHDVHAVMQRKRESADVVARKHRNAFSKRQCGEKRK